MDEKNVLGILGLVVIVAVVVSLATVNLTGAIIKVQSDPNGDYNVYTYNEMKNLLKQVVAIDSGACKADELCEMNNSQVNNSLSVGRYPSIGIFMEPEGNIMGSYNPTINITNVSARTVVSTYEISLANTKPYVGTTSIKLNPDSIQFVTPTNTWNCAPDSNGNFVCS